MKEIHRKDGQLEVMCHIKELLIIHAALNEVCNGIDLFEFETRMGANREEVKNLLEALTKILDK